jgi:hypothetical protein
VVMPDRFDAWTAAAHFALERDREALLALVHRGQRQLTLYAYAATPAQLEAAMKKLHETNAARWAINEDRAWSEYESAKTLANPPPPIEPTDATARVLPAAVTVPAPAAPETVRCSPIETPLGYLSGRDHIHVDAIRFDHDTQCLVLAGDLAGDGEWIGFELHFGGVAAVASEDADRSAWSAMSDLHDVLDSPWPAAYAADGTPRRHVIVQAYDELFHVTCTDVTLQLGARRPHEPESPDDR